MVWKRFPYQIFPNFAFAWMISSELSDWLWLLSFNGLRDNIIIFSTSQIFGGQFYEMDVWNKFLIQNNLHYIEELHMELFIKIDLAWQMAQVLSQ